MLSERYYTQILKIYLNEPRETVLEHMVLANKIDKLHRFKKTDLGTLKRVKDIIGIIKSLKYEIQSIVDFGSQRGALLFPLIDNFPDIEFTSVDISDEVASFLKKIENHNAYNMKFIKGDITTVISPIESNSADIVIASEILEHLEKPLDAIIEAKRIAKKYILITVPSKPDNNPEHIQFFQIDDMIKLLKKAGIENVNVHSNKTYNLFIVSI